MVEFRFAYTGATQLFQTRDAKMQANVVQALKDAPLNSGVYGTVMGRAILSHAWNSVIMNYAYRLIFQVIYLFALVHILGTAIRMQYVPSVSQRFLVLFLGIIDFLHFGIDFVGSYMINCSLAQTMVEHLIGWNIYNVLVNVYSIVLFIDMTTETWWEIGFHGYDSMANMTSKLDVRMGNYTCADDHACGLWLHDHPVRITFLIGTKASKFCVDMLCIRALGEHLLPAFRAVASEASTRFILYVGFLTLCSFFAFYTLPVDTDKGLLHTFLLMFRLDIEGDFDLGDLEGVNQKLDFKTGEIDDGQPTVLYHLGVRYMFVVLVIFINIILMNVYIGLLSSIYDDLVQKRRQLFAEFRAVYTWRYLCSIHVWERFASTSFAQTIYRELAARVNIDGFLRWCGVQHEQLDDEGIWIAYNANNFKDEFLNTNQSIDVIYKYVVDTMNKEPEDTSLRKNARNFF